MPVLPFGDGWAVGVQSQGRVSGVEMGSVGLSCPLCMQPGRFPSPTANPGGVEQGRGFLPPGTHLCQRLHGKEAKLLLLLHSPRSARQQHVARSPK